VAGARAACALALSLALSLLPVPAHSAAGTSPTAAGQTAAAAQSGLTLTRVSPVVAGPSEPVTLTGILDVAALGVDVPAAAPAAAPSVSAGSPSLIGTAEDVVATVEVRLGSGRVGSHEDVDEWLAGDGPSQGRVLATAAVLTAPESTPDRVPFRVTIGDLGEWMRDAYGVLPVSVEVWPPDAAEPASVVRTFVGYQVRKEYEPLRLTWVVPITVPYGPTLVGEFGEERTAAWEALLGEGGDLRERLESASDPNAVWAVDPALLSSGPAPEQTAEDPDEDADEEPVEPTETTTAGPPTTGGTPAAATSPVPDSPTGGAIPDGPTPNGPTPTASDPEQTGEDPDEEDPAVVEHRVRTEFAMLLLEATRGREVLLLPAHDADVAALPAPASQGRTPAAIRSVIDRSLDVDEGRALLLGAGATVTPTAWPVAGGWSAPLDAALHDLSDVTETPWSVLSSTASLSEPVRGPFPAASGSAVLPYDALLSERASETQDRRGALTSALAVMADSLVLLNERPGTTRHVMVALDRHGSAADVSDDLTSVLAGVPWLDATGVAAATYDGALVEQAPAAPAATILADGRARDLAVTTAQLPVAASVRAGSEADLATRGADTLAHLTSARWRGHAQEWSAAYDPIATDVAETFTGLTIPSRDISFLADSGLLRVTVENSLDTGIENATLDLTVEHPILRIENGPQTVEVGADSRSTVGFEAIAIASGRVSVTATLRAPDGTVLGEPTQFSVRVSPTSDWIYWVLGGLAAVVIVIGLVRTALRRRPSV
jgi:hypothetical protein